MSARNISSRQFSALAGQLNGQDARGEDIGFSVHTTSADAGQAVTDAYMVGGAGAPEGHVPLPAQGSDLKRYHDENISAMSQSNVAMGAWGPGDRPHVVLDASSIHPRGVEGMAGALRQASDRGEEAIGSVSGGKYQGTIPTHRNDGTMLITGSGRVPDPRR